MEFVIVMFARAKKAYFFTNTSLLPLTCCLRLYLKMRNLMVFAILKFIRLSNLCVDAYNSQSTWSGSVENKGGCIHPQDQELLFNKFCLYLH